MRQQSSTSMPFSPVSSLFFFSVRDSHSAGLLRFCLPLQQKGIEFDSNGSPQVPLEIRLQLTKWPPFTTSHQLNGYFNIFGADCGWIRSLF